MNAKEVKKYLSKLNKFNEWELNQRKNLNPELSFKKFIALYKFGMHNFSSERIEAHHQKHLENLIKTQKNFRKIL